MMDDLNVMRPLGRVAPGEAGGKAQRLAKLIRWGFAVPEAYVIPASATELVMAHGGVKSAPELGTLRSLPPPIVQDLEMVLDAHPEVKFVARSSALTEDHPFASAAGQYETFLNLDTLEAVVRGVVAVYRTLGNLGVHKYLEARGIAVGGQRMAVILQAMVHPEVAGVLFTRSPVNPDQMVAEYVEGLGTAVVSGRGDPHRLLISRTDEGARPNDRLGVALFDAGSRLERLLDGPQDIEWGWDGERGLVLFQSRDIAPARTTRARCFAPIQVGAEAIPIAPGVAVGRVGPLGATSGRIGVFDPNVGAIEPGRLVVDVDAVALTQGGLLTHLATVCRELGVVAVRVNRMDIPAPGTTVVIDGDSGRVALLDDLDPVARKHAVFDWADRQADRPERRFRRKLVVEGVITDQAIVSRTWQRLLARGILAPEMVQEIRPFDFEPRVYCGVSARLQLTKAEQRLQFKYARSDEGRWRRDYEVHLSLESREQGELLLTELGFVARPLQERVISRTAVGDAIVQFNLWPGATGVYVGIESAAEGGLLRSLVELDIPTDAVAALDGVDLFQLFDISLDPCTFEGKVTTMVDLLGAGP